ncbi:Uncharacterized protein dnl_44200 [Desulfonema limicola]|uniref:Uncharacterized protein n=1 Tax=Desulfonema limicola TaxID=45656 RepID=A0A975BB17_9BACT|nr:hypothetical protein [Desulfonema limicola]QTA82056.1 Uncharacterized protein dnl_44200 [Desulfonema limicola]
MLQAKQEVQQLLNQLPESVSFDDIQYHIYVRQKIKRGIEDVESGNTISEEEFDKRMSRWLEP